VSPRSLLTSLRQEKIALIAALVMIVLFVLSAGAPLIFGTDPNASEVTERLQPPAYFGGEHFLGTDQLGRDLLVRMLYGLRTSFLVGIVGVAIGACLGALLGLTAGYFGRFVDALVMRTSEVQMSFPALLFAMLLVSVFGGNTLVVILALGLNSWMLYARVSRSVVLSFRSSDFVLGGVAIGARPRRMIFRHLLPNSLPQLVSVGTLELARLMLGEATLSFLGLGVQPPTVSLGAILASGRDYLATQWWVSTFSGFLLALAVLSVNLVGTWLRSAGDPTTRKRPAVDRVGV